MTMDDLFPVPVWRFVVADVSEAVKHTHPAWSRCDASS